MVYQIELLEPQTILSNKVTYYHFLNLIETAYIYRSSRTRVNIKIILGYKLSISLPGVLMGVIGFFVMSEASKSNSVGSDLERRKHYCLHT